MRYSLAINGVKGAARFATLQKAMDTVTREMIENNRTVIVHDESGRGYFCAHHCQVSTMSIGGIECRSLTREECNALENQ